MINGKKGTKTLAIKALSIALLTMAAATVSSRPIVTWDMLASNEADSAFFQKYPYIQFLEIDEDMPTQLTDHDFYEKSGAVVFPVNKFNLPTNSKLLKELADSIIPRINRDSLELAYMVVRGAASPEGPVKFNEMLADKRTMALFDFINERLTFPVDKERFRLNAEVEDYRMLCLLMSEAGDADYNTVKSLCDRYLPTKNIAALKSALRRLQGGRLWNRLLRTYFPQLRAARIIIYFRKAKPQGIGEPSPVVVPTPPDTVELPPVVEPVVIEQPSQAVIEPRRELLSVKTNLLFDLAYMPGYNRWCPIPNMAVEYYPTRGHFTFGASFDCPWWQHYNQHKFFQVRNYQVETRYYLRSGDIQNNPPGEGAAFRGFYLQAYAHAGLFSICFDADRGWEGEGAGGGLGLGYVLPLSKKGHWRLEFAAQFGFFRCKYDPYQFRYRGDNAPDDQLYYYDWTLSPDLFKRRQYRYNWFGPTRIGITLSYDLLYRRNHRSGLSLCPTERRTAQ